MFLRKTNLVLLTLALFLSHALIGQTINFGSSGLVGESLNNPTSLDFGPNQKLYVAQQNGTIWEYEVQRDGAPAGSGTYTIISANAINEIKNNTPNHNDDGTSNPTNARQVTGILAVGTAANPVLYVTSSDSRIGGGGGAGNDANLDTNSGLLTRLTWNGSTWDRVDLVRGLPRCEENHSTNGLSIYNLNNNDYLLIQQGGNTNQGAPSNNFAGTSETYLSGALLVIDLTQLEQMETANGGPYTDTRSGIDYIYDLPTLNDPERLDITNTHPNFPYGPSHPMYNSTIDLGDPFGGNNGLNQAFPETGGPLQIFSPGYRNAYDLVVTADGRIFSQDNGPNGGWGGAPLIYDSADQLKGTHHTTTYDQAAGDYVTNEFNIENGTSIGDALHYVGTTSDPNNTYYAGHPAPIRAFPSRADVYNYEYNGSAWVESGAYTWASLIAGVSGYFNTTFDILDFPDDPRQGEYLSGNTSSSKVNILDVVNSSTNGMCEYTASNFGGAMQGDILAASFNGNINRYIIDGTGTGLASKNNSFLNGFGSVPLDVIAMGDSDPFPGTIWAATYGADNITIFEPGDFLSCYNPGDPEYDPQADYDGDGFTNADEIANGTNHCSGGSSPNDNDGDFISDLTDTDDDNDGIPDLQDAFAIDNSNGNSLNLPVHYPFWNNDPGTGFFGLGFTGLMLDPSGITDYLNQYDEVNLSFGGAGGKATIDAVPSGDALQGQNSQENAFQFGVNVNSSSPAFTVHSKIETPFNGSPPLNSQSYGIFIGNGDQDNYLKVVIMDGVNSGDTTYGFEVLLEENGVANSTKYDTPGLLQAGGVDIYLSVDPQTNSVQPYYSLNDGEDVFSLGSPVVLPTSFLDPNDNQGLAVGIISTSGTSGFPYIATWDFINVTEDQPSSLANNPSILDFGSSQINSGVSQLNLEVTNLGGPAQGGIDITAISFSGPDASLFQSSLALPLNVGVGTDKLIPVSFTPNAVTGIKTATLEIVHTGVNSPLNVPLTAVLTDLPEPLVRISAGSNSTVTASDGGPDWESNPNNGSYTGTFYSVNTGNNYNGSFSYANRDSSIPAYIDTQTFSGIFGRERYDPGASPEMDFSIPLANGDYTVNLYMGNSWGGSSEVGERIFDISIEGILVENDLDLVSRFGHQVAGMISYAATVSDGTLNISFGHVVQNPLVNAIEILGIAPSQNQAPVAVAQSDVTSGDIPLLVNFVGSQSTDDAAVTGYSWNFGDGNSSTEADPAHTYTLEGTFNAVLTVFDIEGLSDVDSLSIVVDDPATNLPPVAVASATPLSGEAPLDVSFTGSNSTDDSAVTSYSWDFGDGNTSTEADPNHIYATAGTFDAVLTVFDAEGLSDVDSLLLDITPDLPPTLALTPDPLDFGSAETDSNPINQDVQALNEGITGEIITITDINITGTHAPLFSHGATLPLTIDGQLSELITVTFSPNGIAGSKTATLELVHDGGNSPSSVPLTAVLTDPPTQGPVVRISAGGNTTVSATDGGPDWESNPSNGAYSGTAYSVNTGINFSSTFQYANRDSSIPAYIDSATFGAIFARERYDRSGAPEMEFSIPLPDGDYIVNLFMGNSYAGTSQPGDRIFDILLEGQLVEDNLDLSATFGHQVGGMISHLVSINDGTLNISFGHEVENPLVNAIEIIGGVNVNQPPVAIATANFLTGEVPLDIDFTGSTSTDDSGITSYSWDFGDGNSSTQADPSHTFNTEGIFDVVLTVFDGEGLSDVDSLVVTVSPDLPANLTLSPDPLDFGSQFINSSAAALDVDAFNQDTPGQPINITAINFSGTDAAMFSHSTGLPLAVDGQSSELISITFTPDGIVGSKTATLEVIHDGDNSPSTISLTAVLTDFPPLVLDPITDQFNEVGESSSLVISASGGDPNENVTYSISGQPAGLDIEPTNGQIIGSIDPSALTGGPAGDGIHSVTITASKPGSTDDSTVISWTVTAITGLSWVDKNEDETYTARHECSFVQAGDKFYLFGGRESPSTLNIYDYTTDTWNTLVNSAPVAFNHFQALEFQGLIWVIGAFKDNNFPTETPEDFIWSYNPATDEWVQGPEIPAGRKRGSTGLVAYNDKFYILGGNTIGHSGGYVSWFDEYDPATGIWTVLSDAPRARDHFHAAVVNDKLYAASGRLSGGPGGVFGPVIAEVDVYDFATSSWSTLPSAENLPTPRAAAVVANFENKLLIAGGEIPDSTSALSVTEIYDPTTQSWATGADLVHARHGTQGIVSGPGIFVTAGSPNRGGGNQKNMEFYGDDAPVGSPSVGSTLSAPGSLDFTIGETKNFTIDATGGNTGIIVTSMQISGPDASEFNLDSGELIYGMIFSDTQHAVSITHTGSLVNQTAQLTINYENSGSMVIDLDVSPSSGNQPPVAIAIASPLSGEAPLDINFTGSTSSDDSAVTSFSWDFGDGNSSTVADPSHTYTIPGNYDVVLTVFDIEGLSDVDSLQIDVSPDLPPDLALNPDPLDFGTMDINSAVANLNLDAFNQGSVGEIINISAINITGTNAAMFTHNESLPLSIDAQNSQLIPISFAPDGVEGIKTATLEVIHDGGNSPISVNLTANLTDPSNQVPLVRISVGGASDITATDGGPDWESNPSSGSYSGTSYSVNTGNNGNASFQYANRHSSIPAYIDQSTFSGLFSRERYDRSSGQEMEFTVPLANGDYTVNIYMGNSYAGTSQPGSRIFDILLEGIIVEDNLDLSATFGHQTAAMLSYSVTVVDGVLNVSFGHEVENPLLNGIEILGAGAGSGSREEPANTKGNVGNQAETAENGQLIIPESNSAIIQFGIRPNPARNHFSVDFNHPTDGLKEVYLHAMDGRLIKRYNVNNTDPEQLPIFDLEDGLYIVTCVSKNGQVRQEKLVVKN